MQMSQEIQLDGSNKIRLQVDNDSSRYEYRLSVEVYDPKNYEWNLLGTITDKEEIRQFGKMFQRITDFID